MSIRSLLIPLVTPFLLASEPAPILALSEIQAGMKGYGRTVFHGNKIERFQFEVLGVQRNVTPGHSLILVKASGGPLADTGILKGMSGSPCYIDGKLVGALSSGWAFQKEPLGGITPIEEMLDQLKEIPETPSLRTPLILPKLEPPKVMKAALTGEMIPLAQLMGAAEGTSGAALPMPLCGTELLPEARALWQGVPVSFASGTVVAARAAGRGTEASPLEPGGMLSVSLVQGDMEMAGMLETDINAMEDIRKAHRLEVRVDGPKYRITAKE